jgi:hypothetical protein
MLTIPANKELHVYCEITAENYKDILVTAELINGRICAAIYHKTQLHENTFVCQPLINALAAYFDGSLSEETPELNCPINLELMKNPAILPSGSIVEYTAAQTLHQQGSSDPLTRRPFNYILSAPIMSFLIQKAKKEELREEIKQEVSVDKRVDATEEKKSEKPVEKLRKAQLTISGSLSVFAIKAHTPLLSCRAEYAKRSRHNI